MKRESIIQGFPICVALLIFVVLTSACVRIGPAMKIHSVDKLPEEVAVIKGRYYFALYYEGVLTLKIDGKYVGSIRDEILPASTKVEVLPGWHELVIVHAIVSLLYIDAECARGAFNFEAGHEYKIKFPFFSHLVEVIDVNTGVTVFSHTSGPCDPQR